MEVKKYAIPTTVATAAGAAIGAGTEMYWQKKYVIGADEDTFVKFTKTVDKVHMAKYKQLHSDLSNPAATKRISRQLVNSNARAIGAFCGAACLGVLILKNIFTKSNKK